VSEGKILKRHTLAVDSNANGKCILNTNERITGINEFRLEATFYILKTSGVLYLSAMTKKTYIVHTTKSGGVTT
jgi:hypothetical protein